ncbi:MAG: pantetheine-phosphate adenylyltransferase [Anaerolineae bacterium]|nr:pantetheine-phosphate adenylyltransferase [Anaerolineae bacterium]
MVIYPGTFDPIHYGHIDIALRAASLFDRLILGVYDRPNKHLLFSKEDRVALARDALKDVPNIEVATYSGLTVDFARTCDAQAIVRGLRVISDFELEYQMALTNQKLAPDVEMLCLMTRGEYAFISSSIVKEICNLGGDISDMVPAVVQEALELKRDEGLHHGGRIISLRD